MASHAISSAWFAVPMMDQRSAQPPMSYFQALQTTSQSTRWSTLSTEYTSILKSARLEPRYFKLLLLK